MSTATHVRLGVFTLLTFGALVAIALGLGWSVTKREKILFHTYFDEAVDGLETGAPVLFRGVRIGTVKGIDVAPDRRRVAVELALQGADVRRLGLTERPPDLRTQLGSQGITGVKFVDLDFFDPAENPPPPLPFAPEENYIPAAPSMLKSLTDSVNRVMPELPKIVSSVQVSLADLSKLVGELKGHRVGERAGVALDDIDAAAGELKRLLQSANDEQLAKKAGATADDLRRSLAKLDAAVDQLGGKDGVLAGANQASQSLAELGRTAQGSAERLPRTLRDVDEAAQALRELLQSLERDPAMLVKGPASGQTPAKTRTP